MNTEYSSTSLMGVSPLILSQHWLIFEQDTLKNFYSHAAYKMATGMLTKPFFLMLTFYELLSIASK